MTLRHGGICVTVLTQYGSDRRTDWRKCCINIALGFNKKTFNGCLAAVQVWTSGHRPLLPSGAASGSLSYRAVNPQVTGAINPAVGCRYFPPSQRLPSQP